jgi:hypothetical protein
MCNFAEIAIGYPDAHRPSLLLINLNQQPSKQLLMPQALVGFEGFGGGDRRCWVRWVAKKDWMSENNMAIKTENTTGGEI